jgi:SSS family solute:Na+ symporter
MPELRIQIGTVVFNSFWIGSVLVVLLTGLYTIVGGMRAVAYTDAVQTFILVAGSLVLTAVVSAASVVGASFAHARTGAVQPVEAVHSRRRRRHVGTGQRARRMAWYFNQNFPWVGMLFAAPIIGLWYWCTDQYIVQRALGAPNEREARRGTIFAAFLKLLPVFIFIVPGMVAVALARTDVCGTRLSRRCSRKRGCGVGPGRLSAPRPARDAFRPARSCRRRAPGRAHELSRGAFNASSTLFTIDVYQKFRPHASQARLVWIGRIATTVMVIIALAWIPVIQARADCTNTCRACRRTSHHRLRRCSFSACS